jgi:hypothetical protein
MKATSLFLIVFSIVAASVESSSGQSCLTNGLVAYYPFTGNANEATGQGSNGVVVGAVLCEDRFGNSNQAYAFDGATTWIQTTNYWPIIGTNAVTVSCWINYNGGIPQPLAESTMLSCDGNLTPGSRFQFSLHDGGGFTTLVMDSGGNEAVANTIIPTGQWCQVVVVLPANSSPSDTVYYLNGTQVPTFPGADTSYVFNFVPTDSLTLGHGSLSEQQASGRVFNGKLDDFRIYNRALSTNEVAQLYAAEAPTFLNLNKAVYLDSVTLKIGTNYQLQISSDMNTWSNFGSSFTATNYLWSPTNYWNVSDWNQLYFRLKSLP